MKRIVINLFNNAKFIHVKTKLDLNKSNEYNSRHKLKLQVHSAKTKCYIETMLIYKQLHIELFY